MNWLSVIIWVFLAVFVGIPTYCLLGKILRLTLIDFLIRVANMLYNWNFASWSTGYKKDIYDVQDDFLYFVIMWPVGFFLLCAIFLLTFTFRLCWLIWQGLKAWWRFVSALNS